MTCIWSINAFHLNCRTHAFKSLSNCTCIATAWAGNIRKRREQHPNQKLNHGATVRSWAKMARQGHLSFYAKNFVFLYNKADQTSLSSQRLQEWKKINRDWFFQSKKKICKKTIDFACFFLRSIAAHSTYFSKKRSLFVLKFNRFFTWFFCFWHVFCCVHMCNLPACIYTYRYTYINAYIQTYRHIYIYTLHYITLHYITLHYITLHYITLHYITYIHPFHCIALHYITLHYITYIHYIHTCMHACIHTLHCIALRCIALHCNALHYITLHCITLHYITVHFIALHCIALHCAALHRIALHCVALHCIALHCIALHCIALHCIA